MLVALAVALLQLGVDLAARLVDISAAPALVAFHLLVATTILSGTALAARAVAARLPPGSGVEAERYRYLLVALAASVVVLGGRLGTGTAAPTVRLLVPVAFVAPAALALDAIGERRRGDGLPPAGVVVHVAVVAAALGALAGASLPLDPPYFRVQAIELRWAAAFIVAAAGAALASQRRLDTAAARLAVAAVCGLAVALVAAGGRADRLWLIRAAATLAVAMATLGLLRGMGVLRPVRSFDLGGLRRRAGGSIARLSRPVTRLLDTAIRSAAPAVLAPSRRLDRSGRIGAGVVVVGSTASIALRVAWALRVGWQPTGNVPTVMARAYDVGTSNHPLVGTVTSLGAAGGANHPGPLLFDVLAPFARLLGLRTGGFVGAALLNLGYWLVAVWAAFRAGGRTVAIGAWLVGALVIHVPVLGAVWEPFNTTVVLLAIYAVALASWAAASGAWRAWWWAVALGSLCAQAYLPMALLVIGPVLWSGLAMAGAARAATDPECSRQARRAVRGGLLIGAVAWAQPAIDVVANGGGNVRALVENVAAPRPAVGIAGVWRAVGWVLAVPPKWDRVTGTIASAGSADAFLGGPVVPGLVVATVLGVVWWRGRERPAMVDHQLRVVAVLVLVGAAVNVTQLPRTNIRAYTVVWLVVASMVVGFAIAVSVGFEVARRRPPSGSWPGLARWGLLSVASVLVLGSGLATPSSIADVKGRPYTIDAMVPTLVEQVNRSTGGEEVLVLAMDTQFNQVMADTLVSNMIVDGRPVLVEPDIGNYYGTARMAGPDWTGTMLWVTNASAPGRPPGRRIARAEVAGWTEQRFEDVAQKIEAFVAGNGPVRFRTGTGLDLSKYLSGWIDGDVCVQAERSASGRDLPGSVPAGALAWLYADGAVTAPVLPDELRVEVEELVGLAPVEVWRVQTTKTSAPPSSRLLRDGSQCRR